MRYTIYKNYLNKWSLRDNVSPLSAITSKVFNTIEQAEAWMNELNKQEVTA